MMILLVLFGGALVSGLLAPLGLIDVGIAVAILLVVRPMAGLIGLFGLKASTSEKLTLAFFGDGKSNMGHSYVLAGVTAGMHVRVASPESYAPRDDVIADADRIAAGTGGSVTLYTDPLEAASGADVIVTDTWVSMGKEEEKLARLRDLGAYKVTQETMSLAQDDAIFIHCLPADRGYEVDAEVIDGPQSVVWDEAENRLHAQKALLEYLVCGRVE